MEPKFEPRSTFASIERYRIERLAVVPTMLRVALAALEAGDRDLQNMIDGVSTLRQLLIGGESLGAALAARTATFIPNAALTDIYGLTETFTSDFMLLPGEREQFPGSIGRPTPGVHYRIAGGELQIRAPFIMSGYLDDETLTNAAFSDGFLRRATSRAKVGAWCICRAGRRPRRQRFGARRRHTPLASSSFCSTLLLSAMGYLVANK